MGDFAGDGEPTGESMAEANGVGDWIPASAAVTEVGIGLTGYSSAAVPTLPRKTSVRMLVSRTESGVPSNTTRPMSST